MKNFKKAIGMSMAAVMAVSMMGTLPAAAEEVTDEVVEYSTIEEYIEYVIPNYVRAQSVEINGTFYYSNTIDIYNINDIESGSRGECVFFFDDDKIVGKMQVRKHNGEYASVFDTHITDEMQGSFDGDYAIAFGYFNDDFYSFDEMVGSTFVDGPGFEECPDYALPLNESIIKAASMDLAAIPAPYAASASLNVPHVANTACDYGHGLCWAACMAMMVNYRNGKSLSALRVWQDMKTSDNPDPVGDINIISRAFNNIYNYDHALFVNRSISASEVLGALSSNKPVYIAVSRGDFAHTLVICGVVFNNSTSTSSIITYTVKDPNNKNSVQSFTVVGSPTKAINSIAYISDDIVYDEWTDTIY
ncbi:MAG: C39 family peptidase [Oscillospiraceae bacterium]|nr:C39 family peptidase [Oscillospiraceae bacterium]